MDAGSVVLLHSPLVAAATWGELPAELRRLGLAVTVVDVDADEQPPYASRYIAHAAQQLAALSPQGPLVLVGHSGAGPLLPQVALSQRAAGRSVGGYLFLDAGLPRAGATRLDLLTEEDADMAAAFRADLVVGGSFPAWDDESLAEALPDPQHRRLVLGGVRPRRLDFFTETLPHPEDWPDAPCGYLRTSDAYVHWAHIAQLRGWAVAVHRPDQLLGHFAQLRDPAGVAAALRDLLAEM